jgi:hypothetical protein
MNRRSAFSIDPQSEDRQPPSTPKQLWKIVQARCSQIREISRTPRSEPKRRM